MSLNLSYTSLDFMGIPIIVSGKKIQNRKHGKKRINKKWIKRYGYKYTGLPTDDEKIFMIPNGNGFSLLMNIRTYEKLSTNLQMAKDIKEYYENFRKQKQF